MSDIADFNFVPLENMASYIHTYSRLQRPWQALPETDAYPPYPFGREITIPDVYPGLPQAS
jgi:hypothetical protein